MRVYLQYESQSRLPRKSQAKGEGQARDIAKARLPALTCSGYSRVFPVNLHTTLDAYFGLL